MTALHKSLSPLRFGVVVLFAAIFSAHMSVLAAAESSALALLKRSEALMRGTGTEGTYSVRIIRPDWQRELRLTSIDDAANNRFRLEMLKPRKVKGTVFLKKAGKLTMYLPKLRREIAISPAMMHDPWMGSDFNNQDLLEAAALIDQYQHKILSKEGEGDTAVYTIESTPKPDATVSWIRLEQKIRADGLPLSVHYYCRREDRQRVLRFEAPKELGGRLVPSRWVMQPLTKPDERTVIEVEQMRFGVEPDDALFEVDTGKRPVKNR